MSKTILVTGAGRGLGRTLAERLSARGDTVIAHARSAEALAGVPHAKALVADLADPASLAEAVAGLGVDRLDALVHNAGVLNVSPVAEETLEVWQRTMAVNVVSVAELTRLLLPSLRAARGHVFFLNSGAGLNTAPRLASYSASKHALKAIADALRAEEQANGLRVTSFYPSHFDTDMQRGLRDQYDSDYDPSRAMSQETVASTILTVLDAPADMVVNELRTEPPNPLPIRPRG
ncbi:NADP-dependent 3-hydroxy acid dehydrogenase YdfG [Glycomyces sambucus]|uniref:NADP-dependent 3-hydroxy acid dehydrogenase YdfG n=1 Tax=Glycomyces sambucus TaxID=380244 RepID=A0A1G9DZ58_9ACTN|nr:SDR family oxidoreductase [Glycomyces sambucus]SDK69098.1 NADP-dependent 3-hydroxy acid dehydrogenase YdfG [Glycomyces sambucus]